VPTNDRSGTKKVTSSDKLGNKLDDLDEIIAAWPELPEHIKADREQNEMLGYHRKNAPNPEKEEAKIQRAKEKVEAFERIAQIRTTELAEGRFNDN